MKSKKLFCPVCKKSKEEKFWAMSGYRLARCKNCKMVWDFFPPDNLLAQYDKRYFINENPKGGYANYFDGMAVNKKTFSNRLKKIEKRFGKGKLLDVGCALGDCLVEAKRLGWKEAEGLEISAYAYKFAKKRGLKVKEGVLGNNTYAKDSFDIVLYQDVIEHVTDPVQELKRVKGILKPGGIVYLVTPDVGGLWSKLLGPFWYHYKPVEHVMYFSQETMRRALKNAGFTDIKTAKTYHILSLEYIMNRLRYYAPTFFDFMLKILKNTPFRNISFKAFTGELEAWGQKPN
ncbi:class I SAM-dependent methyltransferase [Patescibacteria group bacterium]|nr:class I SAM-dependent methyltransferase [Patescibacteria group bacterium]MBU0777338.1 class I SAM-dependent methyltransferase [Patescibacteria group bacterium]MBU0845966.1 class I SAM-dependent methyltransferase [Patescibacteria group bacterium]MBU0922514.1 class I SAM-dependent methyltransferase [Patescibacteria group bacterium]MBU1066308.1 class I SAM-dependent methyltransferase [Patescibacteria group bacterium]